MGSWFSKPIEGSTYDQADDPASTAILHRKVTDKPPMALSDTNNTLQLSNGLEVYDGSGGAAVSNLGHAYKDQIWEAMGKVYFRVDYVTSLSYGTSIAEALAYELVKSTKGRLTRALIYNSGSDAIESAMKLARQFHVENGEEGRDTFIARGTSYHGATIGALGLSDHKARRRPFECLLNIKVSRVSACFPYRDLTEIETIEQYVQRKAQELENVFQELGPGKVIAFVAEPVSGAALGCVPAVPGYLKAMQDVCHRHGALFILDEIMCGTGRTGTLHAWEQHEGVVPDIQVMGKGLGAGVQPVAAMLCSQRIVDVLGQGSQSFMHGFTFQNHPLPCAAALETLKIIREEYLLKNVCHQGDLLEKLLHKALDSHRNVGNIRGQGLFQGIEFVQNKDTKEPFDPDLHVNWELHEKAKGPGYNIFIYPGGGTVDGERGDHIIIAPPYNITEKQVHMVVAKVAKLINDYFAELNAKIEKSSVH